CDEVGEERVELVVDVELDRADIAEGAVERGSKRQVAVFVPVERRIDDEADRTGISGAIAQSAAAPIDRAGIHAGSATDAFERGPELGQAEALGTAVVVPHEVHLAALERSEKMRGIFSVRRAQIAARKTTPEYR